MDNNHFIKISEAIRFIEAHLNEKMDLNKVAKSVHYSKYHLHRVFAATVGLTIHEYTKRRQMTEAAKLLVFSDKPIIDIATIAGYESQQAFTNIFTAMYKQSPSKYRENEKFYPLQLKLKLEEDYGMLHKNETPLWDITYASEEDILCWMDLVRLVIDGFPHLYETEYVQELKRRIKNKQALLLKDGRTAVGIMFFSYESGSIDFMGTHPFYRDKGIPQAFLNKVMGEMLKGKEISITTFREGDKADTGHRNAIIELGFAEAELLVEFGYPTQRFVLSREEKPDSPFPDEVKHLAETEDKLESALRKADSNVERIDKEYMDTKRYMVQNRGEIDPHEMFQNELALKQIDHKGAFSVEIRSQIAKLKDSPYFARIDFLENNSKDAVPYYIGRFAFHYENELLICDWRAPVAGMFYDCEIGPAGYDAPAGKIEGALTRKRQFKIKGGVMEYALESSSNVHDDILQKELSHTSDEKMKSIISTIQKEQNDIIRNEKAEILIIQGVAGSGKTSVALHRIAFMLYRFRNQINAKNVTILSPNKVFGDYISNVIPELGEEPIYELDFTDIAQICLEHTIGFDADQDPLETHDEKWLQRVRFKSTLKFTVLMDEYIRELPEMIFMPADYTFLGFTVKSEWIRERFYACGKYSIKQRLVRVADDIHDRIRTDNIMQDEVPRTGLILKSLTSMLRIKNTLSLYKDFYHKIGMADHFYMPAKKTLEWNDVYPFLYLHAAFEGLKVSSITKHLVLDEMQDCTPIQFAVMNLLFPCPKTILGDFGQFINPAHLHTLDDLKEIYQGAEVIKLNKSYRSTYEIITFAGRIRQISSLEAVLRHGDEPSCILCKNEYDEIHQIKEAVNDFQAGRRVSLGIILKTNNDAKALYHILSKECEVNLMTPESTSFKNGVTVTSVQMSKGLEFDEVIIPSVNDAVYSTEFDRSLLYIACTRAMHRLTLMYTGIRSRLIP